MASESLREVKALVFDVFGTTFDWWSGVTAQIESISTRESLGLDASAVTDRWREDFFTALASVRTGQREFARLDVLHAEGLDRVLGAGPGLEPEVKDEMVKTWHRLPAWADVHEGLTRLRGHYTLAALSNGGFAQTANLIKNAGLPFDCVLSAQLAGTYKPDARVYRTAVELLDLRPDQLMMVAAHGWDLDGARAVGLRTAYVRRPAEKGPNKPAEDPASVTCDLLVDDFVHLAETLIA
jgi:2-haloacid dehalogenase